jgi:hypothetical protein
MAVKEYDLNDRRYQLPCFIDGKFFPTITAAFQYLTEVNGRIHLDRLERLVRQGGRRILEGHVVTGTKEIDPFSVRN